MFNIFASGFCASACMYCFAEGSISMGIFNLALALLSLTVALK